MYFQNDVHQKNFELICNNRILAAQSDPEYRVAAYILAIPEIHVRSFSDPFLSEVPFLWTVKYEEIQKEGCDSETITSWQLIYDEDDNEINSDEYETLSSGHKALVDLAANLFNGKAEFNLCDSFSSWSHDSITTFQQALEIRFPETYKRLKDDRAKIN
ncbi:MAG: hypothetical protein ACQEUS_20870 [Bacillota bacterium]